MERCKATLGIGVKYECRLPAGHVPPHRVEGYGGMFTSFRVEWFMVAEQERGAIASRPDYDDWDERCPVCWEKPRDLAAHMDEHDETLYPVSGCE